MRARSEACIFCFSNSIWAAKTSKVLVLARVFQHSTIALDHVGPASRTNSASVNGIVIIDIHHEICTSILIGEASIITNLVGQSRSNCVSAVAHNGFGSLIFGHHSALDAQMRHGVLS